MFIFKRFLVGLLTGSLAFPVHANLVRPPKVSPEDIKEVLELGRKAEEEAIAQEPDFKVDYAHLRARATSFGNFVDLILYREFLNSSLEAEFKTRIVAGNRLGLRTARLIKSSPFQFPGLLEKLAIYEDALKNGYYDETEIFQVFLQASHLVSQAQDKIKELDHKYKSNLKLPQTPDLIMQNEQLHLESAYYIMKLDEFFDSESIYSLLLQPVKVMKAEKSLGQKIRDEYGVLLTQDKDPVESFRAMFKSNWPLIKKAAQNNLANQIDLIERSQNPTTKASLITQASNQGFLDGKFFLRHDLLVAKTIGRVPDEDRFAFEQKIQEKLEAAGISVKSQTWMDLSLAVFSEIPFMVGYLALPLITGAADSARSAYRYWTLKEFQWALSTGMGLGLTSFRSGMAVQKMAVGTQGLIDAFSIMSSVLIFGVFGRAAAAGTRGAMQGVVQTTRQTVGRAALAKAKRELNPVAYAQYAEKINVSKTFLAATQAARSFGRAVVYTQRMRLHDLFKAMSAIPEKTALGFVKASYQSVAEVSKLWWADPKHRKSVIMGAAAGLSDFVGTAGLTALMRGDSFWDTVSDPKMMPRLAANLAATGLLSFLSLEGVSIRHLMIFNGLFISSLYYVMEKETNGGLDPDVARLNLWFAMFISTTKARYIFDPLAVRAELGAKRKLLAHPRLGAVAGFGAALLIYAFSNVGGSMGYNLLDDTITTFPALNEKVKNTLATGELPEDFRPPPFLDILSESAEIQGQIRNMKDVR